MKLFISYRRKSWPFTQRLADELGRRIDAQIFIDFTSIDETDFESSILRNLRESDAVLVIVSPETFTRDRIHRDDDWVRREIREALAQKKPITLACVDGLLPPADLPNDIKSIRGKEGVRFFAEFFDPAVERLADFIGRATPIKRLVVSGPSNEADTVEHVGKPKRRRAPHDESTEEHARTPASAKATLRPNKALYAQATTYIEEGKFEDAIFLLENLIASGYRPRAGSIRAVLDEAKRLFEPEQRRREAQDAYDDLTAFVRTARSATMKAQAREAFQQFRKDYPDFGDPANLAKKVLLPFTLPMLEWCNIPAGEVTIEGTVYRVEALRMAKYPVTNEQFQVFIDAPDGYKHPAWWDFSEAALAWRKENTAPKESGFKGDTLPREMVCWYEAMAFCRWLSAKTGLNITLPTEMQWQRAAQGDDGREYPWGNKFDKGRCNTDESGIRQTTPVDRYPQGASPYGVLDMSGNVSEWCLNEWYSPDYLSIYDSNRRGLRGGSWGSGYGSARVVTRFKSTPDDCDNFIGFRVCVCP
jgi:tetratricopeptide (TPR) repeat protein